MSNVDIGREIARIRALPGQNFHAIAFQALQDAINDLRAATTPAVTPAATSLALGAASSPTVVAPAPISVPGFKLLVNGVPAANNSANLSRNLPSPSAGFGSVLTNIDNTVNPPNVGFSFGNVGGVNELTADYTAQASDNGLLLVMNSGSAHTIKMPAAPPFPGWWTALQNIGAGVLTANPNGLDFDGSASNLSLTQNQGIVVFTDGTNYFTMRGIGSSGITFQTNGVNNGSQVLLNLAASTNMTLTNTSGGTVTFAAASGGGGGGMTVLTLSGTSGTYLGFTAFPATVTITPGVNHVLHIRLSGYRSATTVSWGLNLCKDSTHGYTIRGQNDGNLVNYYYNGSLNAISSSGSGVDNEKGPFLIDVYLSISATGVNGVGWGAWYSSPNSPLRVWPTVTNNTQIDMTGSLTIAIEIDAVANVNSVNYEIL